MYIHIPSFSSSPRPLFLFLFLSSLTSPLPLLSLSFSDTSLSSSFLSSFSSSLALFYFLSPPLPFHPLFLPLSLPTIPSLSRYMDVYDWFSVEVEDSPFVGHTARNQEALLVEEGGRA